MAKDTALVTTEGEQETSCKLSNGTIFQWPWVAFNLHFKVTIILDVKYYIYSMVPCPVTLSDP